MVLEATIIVVDNSEWMRNGDFSPNRYEAVKDAVNLVTGTKTNSHPENTVGLLSNSGPSIRVLATLTTDPGRILAAMHNIAIGGEASFVEGIQVAQLGLKHRQNKRQAQRIVAFVGSPIKQEIKAVEMLGKRLKKNKIAVDVIALGEENRDKLEAFHKAVNNNDNSNLVIVPAGAGFVTDAVMSSPIVGGGSGGFESGVDPNVDPELAMVIRMSMMEAEQARNAQAGGDNAATPQEGAAGGDVTMADATGDANVDEDDDDDLLQQAIALSMSAVQESAGNEAQDNMEVDDDEDDEEEQMRLALEMSMLDHQAETQGETSAEPDKAKEEEAAPDLGEIAGNRDLMESMLADLPGVDPNDPNIKSILDQMSGAKDKKDESK